MNPNRLLYCLVLLFLPFSNLLAGEKTLSLDLWPGMPPGITAATGEKTDETKPKDNQVAGRRVIRMGQVSKPTITLYRPGKDKSNGTCVLVCPGGGYNILALDLEGTEVCEWLNSLGVTAVLLEYRVPRPKSGAYHLPAAMDAQRAMRLVRSRAKGWNIDPKKIGILGFSAGGHLSAFTSTNFDTNTYDPLDETDKVSSRPDFTVLVYPAYLVDPKKGALNPEIRVSDRSPPTFFAHAADDPVIAESSVQMYRALKAARVPAELHIWERGGHGYGLRKTGRPVSAWPSRCEEWLREHGLVGK